MTDDPDGPVGCLFPGDWPRAPLVQWIVGLGAFAILLAALYWIITVLDILPA